MASISPSAGGKLPPAVTASPLRLGRAFFSGLPTTLVSSARPLPKMPAALPSGARPWLLLLRLLLAEESGGVATPALGDFRGLEALSGSAECARLSCR